MVRCIICDIHCSHFKAVIAELQAKVIKHIHLSLLNVLLECLVFMYCTVCYWYYGVVIFQADKVYQEEKGTHDVSNKQFLPPPTSKPPSYNYVVVLFSIMISDSW